MPLIEITRIGDGDPIPLSGGADQPFDGIRALGMGDVVASAGVGRAPALHGAGVTEALARRVERGGSYRVHVSPVAVRIATSIRRPSPPTPHSVPIRASPIRSG
ncbi:hypothetical protein ACWDPV_09815 [Gordonia sp. NPDC003504]